MQKWEVYCGLNKSSESLEEPFANVVERAYKLTNLHVIVLIYEYDRPSLYTINELELNDTHCDTLRAFFSVMKRSDHCYLCFAFLAGVTRFSKVSVFSGLNNLRDISLLADFVGICGITSREFEMNFATVIEALCNELDETRDTTLAILKKNATTDISLREKGKMFTTLLAYSMFLHRESYQIIGTQRDPQPF